MSQQSQRLERKITSVRFVPDGLHVKILAVLDDGCTTTLFGYYPDELDFTEAELVGLSIHEAIELFHAKDTAYLQSP